jgi:hypothetical protein
MVARAFTVAGTHSSIPTVRKMTAGTSGTETGLHVGSYGSINGKYIGAHELVRISHDSATSKTTVRYKEDANHIPSAINRFTFSDLVITNIGGTSYSQTFNFQDDSTLDSVSRASNEMIFVFNVNTAFVNTNNYRVEFVPRKGFGDFFVTHGNPQYVNAGSTNYGFNLATTNILTGASISAVGSIQTDARMTKADTVFTLPIETSQYGHKIHSIIWTTSILILMVGENNELDSFSGTAGLAPPGVTSMTIGSSTFNFSDTKNLAGPDAFAGASSYAWIASNPFLSGSTVRVTFN